MNGTVVGVRRSLGDAVQRGDVLFIVEAMKMENEIAAHRSGTLSAIDVAVGDAVESGRRLAVIE
jgi:biotin carboxyl carrier protein